MRHIYRMYKFVKLISDEIKDWQIQNPEIANSGTHYQPQTKATIKKFSSQNKVSYNVAQNVAADVMESDWILVDASSGIAVYCPIRKTRQLVEGVPYFRIGLINEWMKEFGTTFTIAIAVISLAISITVAVVK